jgi:hypothetical protein
MNPRGPNEAPMVHFRHAAAFAAGKKSERALLPIDSAKWIIRGSFQELSAVSVRTSIRPANGTNAK